MLKPFNHPISLPRKKLSAARGFTLVEILVSMGILTIILGFTATAFLRPQSSANLVSITDQLENHLRGQQLKALVGQDHGIKFLTNHYVLFSGNQYITDHPNNQTFEIPLGINLTTNLADQQIIFLAPGGQVSNFYDSNNQLSLTNPNTAQESNFEFNRIGIPLITKN